MRYASPWDRSAFAATTPIVVFKPAPPRSMKPPVSSNGVSSPVSGSRAPAMMPPVDGSTTLPTAFTATTAPTSKPPGPRFKAEPMPPFDGVIPGALPTVAPIPGPTSPDGTGAELAFSQAALPMAASGRTRESPTPRSNNAAAGTIGTRTGPA